MSWGLGGSGVDPPPYGTFLGKDGGPPLLCRRLGLFTLGAGGGGAPEALGLLNAGGGGGAPPKGLL